MAWSSLVTSTFLKSLKQAFCKLRREPHTTQVLKFGRTSLTTTNQTSGHWAAFSTSLWLSTHRSRLKTWKAFTIEFWRAYTQRFPPTTAMIWARFWKVFSKPTPKSAHLAIKFSTCLFSLQNIMSWSCRSKGSQRTHLEKSTCWEQSNSLKTWSLSQVTYPRATTIRTGKRSRRKLRRKWISPTKYDQSPCLTKSLKIRRPRIKMFRGCNRLIGDSTDSPGSKTIFSAVGNERTRVNLTSTCKEETYSLRYSNFRGLKSWSNKSIRWSLLWLLGAATESSLSKKEWWSKNNMKDINNQYKTNQIEKEFPIPSLKEITTFQMLPPTKKT